METETYPKFNIEKRREEDFVTLAAEMLEGQMRTPTEYSFDEQKQELIASDGSEVSKIFDDSLQAAEELVEEAPQLQFELHRRKIEREEYNDMIAMMRGDLPNTMVVVSDFPPELMNYPKDVGGYNVARKQTMLRVISKHGNKLHMHTQSLDRSDRSGLEAIYRGLAFEPKHGELLEQRMHFDATQEQQELLPDELVGVYDETLRNKYGGDFKAGRRIQANERHMNTYEFVRTQEDIVRFAVENIAGASSGEQYDIVAVLADRYVKAKKGHPLPTQNIPHLEPSPADISIRRTILEQELLAVGQQARLEGKVFSGCGMTLANEQSLGAEVQLESDGYGNQTDKEEKYSFDAYQYCVSCQAPPKENEQKQWCGPCGLCRGCDKKAGGKG